MHRILPLGMFLLLLAGLGQAPSVTGQEAPKKLPPELVALIKGPADNFIKHFDKKKQGYLTKEDLPPFLARNIDKFDTNGDGKLDKPEVERMLLVLRKRLELDAEPKKTEPAKPEPKKGDPAKGDEKKAGPVPPTPGLTLADFDALDKKADGQLTRDMVKGTAFEKHFDEIDVNKDGKLDRREFEAWLKKQVKEKK